ncbi:MAG: preprotein translocase subunit YajC [Rhodospirillales bacterium]|nr:preprotein translocase subunit YajC [Rhodospirillales bacterium]
MTDSSPAALPVSSPSASSVTGSEMPMPTPGPVPDAGSVMLWNIGLIVILVVLFYLLLIMPQQRRFKEHKLMLDSLKKGDRIVTGGGLLGRVEKILDDEEVLIDLGNDLKVTALRGTVQTRLEDKKKSKESKDSKESKTTKS